MMTKECPHGWKSTFKSGNITIDDYRIEICDGICDSPDLCGIKDCEYYDITQEGTRKFQKALAHEDSFEAIFGKKSADD